jgi:hypothetical protein
MDSIQFSRSGCVQVLNNGALGSWVVCHCANTTLPESPIVGSLPHVRVRLMPDVASVASSETTLSKCRSSKVILATHPTCRKTSHVGCLVAGDRTGSDENHRKSGKPGPTYAQAATTSQVAQYTQQIGSESLWISGCPVRIACAAKACLDHKP